MSDPDDNAVGGPTTVVGDGVTDLVGATDLITSVTDKGLTELGGVTPTGPTLSPIDEPKPRSAIKTEQSDPFDDPTRLTVDDESSRPTLLGGMTPLPRSGAMKAPSESRRATTQNTLPRSSMDAGIAKKMLGGYRITGVLASGQMGVVYRGEHPTLRKTVAIKSVQSELQTDPTVVARFFAESIVLARIDHPNVVRFHDFGYDAQGSAFLVMELLDGETLTKRLARQRRLDISVATDIALQITQGLAEAHKQGVIHRDIKPDNVFLCADGTVKLLDFGVAKLEGQGPTHTLQGDLLGTAAYMAPEQGRSASESDARSDLYSVGCILFEMVCGVVPFPGSLVETLVAHQTAERPPARALNPDVSSEFDAILDKLLDRDPANRPQTAVDVITALSALEATSKLPVRRPRRPWNVTQRPETQVVTPRPVQLRATIDSIIARLRNEPIALGLLVVVIVLLIALVLR